MIKKLQLIFIFNVLALSLFAQTDINNLKYLIVSSQFTDALELSEKLQNENPYNAEIYYQQAIIYKLSFKYSKAIHSIQKALSFDSENINYLAEYAYILLKRNKEKQARSVFEKVIQKDSLYMNAGIALSNIYLKEKKVKNAYSILHNLYENDTINSYLARNLGLCSIRLKDKRNSIKWLNRAIMLDSTDIKAYELMVNVMVSIENFDIALDFLNKAIKFEPENIKLYKKMGEINVMRNHNYRAIPPYLKAYELDNSDYFIAKDIGICYYKTKKYNKAIEYLDIARKNYKDVQIYSYLARAYNKINKNDSSVFFYNFALGLLRPDNNAIFEVLSEKAESLYQLEKYEEAIETYKLAYEIEIDDYWVDMRKNKICVDIASIYEDELKQKELAIKHYESVKKLEFFIKKKNNYYDYAQQKITKLKEELFFENK